MTTAYLVKIIKNNEKSLYPLLLKTMKNGGAYFHFQLKYFSCDLQNVLVETQDKALRRISELKEQCTLEQSAKVNYFIPMMW